MVFIFILSELLDKRVGGDEKRKAIFKDTVRIRIHSTARDRKRKTTAEEGCSKKNLTK